MAEGKSDQAAKDELAKGMAETGKKTGAGKTAGTGAAGSDEVTKGMSEAGEHPVTDTEEVSRPSGGGAGGTSR